MLALLLALAVSHNPTAPPPPRVDPKLVGCFRHHRSSSGFTLFRTLCLYPDRSASHEESTSFMSPMGGGAREKEVRQGTWSMRKGALAFEDDQGRLVWRAKLQADGLHLDGEWYEREPLPEPEVAEDGAEDEEEVEIDPAILEALRARIREALLRYLAAQRAASGG